MKVAVVCPYDLGRPGGVQHQAGALVGWLNRSGHDAWLVGPGDATRSDTRRVGRPLVVPIAGTRAPVGIGVGMRRALAAAVADADVVHLHEPFMPFVSLAALLADTPPKVGTFHADPPGWARTGYRISRRVLRRGVARLAQVTAVSRVAAAAIDGLADVTLIANGLDAAEVSAPVPRLDHRVAFVGRDEPRKGLDTLLAAWPEIRTAVPGAELVVVGADRADAVDGVRFLGRVSDEEKAVVLSSAAVLCAPNLEGESFGIVIVEAMAAGCAVVASGLPAFVAVAGDAGTFVAPGDAAGLAGAVIRLLDDGERREALRRAGSARAATYSWEQVGAAYLRVYQAALS